MQPHADGLGHPSFEDFLAARVYLQGAGGHGDDDTPGAPDETLVATVLSAVDAEDLPGALDEALTSEAFTAYCDHAAAVARSTVRKVPMGPSFSVLQAREALFGTGIATRLHQADTVWSHAGRLAARLSRASARLPTHEGTSPSAATLGILDDASFPLEFRRLLLATWHGLLASLALNALLERGETSHLVPSLAETTYRGARAAFRFFRGEVSAISHQKREEWVMGAFKQAAEGDGYFAPFSAD